MDDLLIYFGLLDLILILLAVALVAGLIGWGLGRRRRKLFLSQIAEILAVFPQGAVIAWSDGHVILTNDEARQMWGSDPFPARLDGPLADLAREAQSSDGHVVRSLDTSSGLKLQVRAAPLQSGPILLVFEDLTARQHQEAFYRNFISNVSHELKTPLTVIQGHVAAIGEGLADDDPRQTSRRVAAQEAVRLTQLVDNLLLLSRLEMPDFVLELRPVNLEAVAEDAILQLSDLAETRRISLGLQKEGSVPRIVADRARLKQVLINLLDNGIKYNRQGGTVTVCLSADEEQVNVRVTDTKQEVSLREAIEGRAIVLRKGQKEYRLVLVSGE